MAREEADLLRAGAPTTPHEAGADGPLTFVLPQGNPPGGQPSNSSADLSQAVLEMRAGDALRAQGRFDQAFQHYLSALHRNPGNPDAMFRVGISFWYHGKQDQALHHLQQAIAFRPDFSEAHENLGQVLMEMGQIAAALHHARIAMQLAPGRPEPAISFATVLEADRQIDDAVQIVQPLLHQGYLSPRLALLYARLSTSPKSQHEALELIDRAMVDLPTVHREAASLQFMAARLLDSLGEYDRAFAAAERANAMRQVQFDPKGIERFIDDAINFFTPDRLAQLPRATHGSKAPVFIIGMPRSGTTLVEQILSSHPLIHGGGELTWIWQITEVLALRCEREGHPLPGGFANLQTSDMDGLARQYLSAITALSPQSIRITDKYPANFFHLGFISLLFPEARIIHCTRNPMDTCLSCYMSDFASGNLFSFDLGHLGSYYRQYARMMDHWKSVLHIPILDICYEDVVNDLEGQARRLLQFLQVDWDDRCLRFHENSRFVSTLSNQQVRQPIYKSSVGRWRHYEHHLGPLQATLGTH